MHIRERGVIGVYVMIAILTVEPVLSGTGIL